MMATLMQNVVLALLLHLLWLSEPSFAASFDCSRAKTAIENTICGSPELSELDGSLAKAYLAAMAAGHADQLRIDQRAWIRQRNACQTTACLVAAYRGRIAALAPGRVPAAGPPIASASPPIPMPSAPAVAPVVTPDARGHWVQACDRLAAHPDDPEAFVRGVTDGQLDASASVDACERAVPAAPMTARLHFQLARGYLKSGKAELAIDALIAASEMGHGAALATLADLHLVGGQGVAVDPVLAYRLYEKAVASGFQPAAKVLGEFADMTDAFARAEAGEGSASPGSPSQVAFKPYAMPNIVDHIQSKRLDAIAYDEWWVKEYLINIADNIRAVCEGHFSQQDIERLKAHASADHFGLGQAALGANFLGVMATMAQVLNNPKGLATAYGNSADASTESAFDMAMKDTEALFQRQSCHTPGLEQFSRNLTAFVANEQAPVAPEGAVMNACLRDPPPSKYGPRDFCLCFGGGLGKGRISQANRNLLIKDFKTAALAIMTIERNVPQFQACRSGF